VEVRAMAPVARQGGDDFPRLPHPMRGTLYQYPSNDLPQLSTRHWSQ
jgi:hypothetical protein